MEGNGGQEDVKIVLFAGLSCLLLLQLLVSQFGLPLAPYINLPFGPRRCG